MSKLKENIDRILGSSLRCLLPSYWWKRIFGLLVDEIDDVRSTANSKAEDSIPLQHQFSDEFNNDFSI